VLKSAIGNKERSLKRHLTGGEMESTRRPQAPMRGPSREALIKILRRSDAEKHLPITLAKYSPDAVVRKEGKRWVLRVLVEDEDAVRNAFEKALAKNANFTPENTWAFRHPGAIILEAAAKEEFIRSVEKMKWDYGEEDGRGELPFLR
jgi:hypothetical protein